MGEVVINNNYKKLISSTSVGQTGIKGNDVNSKFHPFLKDMVLILAALTTNNVFYIAFSLFIPNLFLTYASNEHPNDTPQEIDSIASNLKSISDSFPFISMFLLSPFIGALSDKYGRKKILYALMFISALDITSCLISYKTKNMYFYYVIHGFCGITEAFNSIAFSYISDITSKEERSKYYALTGITWGLGVLIGILITITIVKVDLTYALYVSYAFLVVTIIIIYFMRESLGLGSQQYQEEALSINNNNNPILSNSGTIIKRIPIETSLNPIKLIKILIAENGGFVTWATFLYFIVSYTSEDVFVTSFIYTNLRYGWGTTQNGIYTGVAGLCILGWSTLCPVFLKYISERKLFSLMLLYGGLMHILFAFSVNQWMWLVTASIGAVALIELSLIQSIISKAIPAELQASALNSVASVSSIAGFLGSAVNQSIFAYFISNRSPVYFPGAQFMINAVVLVLTFFLSIYIWRKYRLLLAKLQPKLIKDEDISIVSIPSEEGDEKQSLVIKKEKLIHRLSKMFKKEL